MRGSGCLDDTRAEQIAWLLGDGRTPEEVQAHFKLSSGDYQAITATDLFQRRLTYLTNKNKRKVKLPTTPDECLAFAKRSLVRLSKSADSDKTKVDALKALASVAIDERKNGQQQVAPQVMSEAMEKLTQL
jgi:hypothetical protein